VNLLSGLRGRRDTEMVVATEQFIARRNRHERVVVHAGVRLHRDEEIVRLYPAMFRPARGS
jgi:hypothetical protein